jgi:hypothetical protein
MGGEREEGIKELLKYVIGRSSANPLLDLLT